MKMENKKSFLAYADWKGMFDALPDEMAGKLVKHLFAYVNDENPNPEDYIVKALFEPIKATLKRDLVKWQIKTNEKSYNGRLGNLKRYYPDIYDKVKNEIITLEQGEELAKTRKTSHGDNLPSLAIANLAVSDSVNVSVSVNDKKKDNNTPPAFNFFNSLISLGAEKKLVNEWIEVRKKKKLTNTETAFDGFVREMEKCGLSINETLRICVEKSWGGLNAKWLENIKPDISSNSEETLEQRAYRLHVEESLKYRS